jgi:hypothetical protein
MKDIEAQVTSILEDEREAARKEAKSKAKFELLWMTVAAVFVTAIDLVGAIFFDTSFSWSNLKWWIPILVAGYIYSRTSHHHAYLSAARDRRLIRIEMQLSAMRPKTEQEVVRELFF